MCTKIINLLFAQSHFKISIHITCFNQRDWKKRVEPQVQQHKLISKRSLTYTLSSTQNLETRVQPQHNLTSVVKFQYFTHFLQPLGHQLSLTVHQTFTFFHHLFLAVFHNLFLKTCTNVYKKSLSLGFSTRLSIKLVQRYS